MGRPILACLHSSIHLNYFESPLTMQKSSRVTSPCCNVVLETIPVMLYGRSHPALRYRVWMTSLWCHVGILPRLQRVINSVVMYDPHASYQQSQSRNTCYVLILSNTCSSIYIPNRRSYGFTAYYNHPHLMQAILRTVAVWAVSTVAKYLQSQLACVIRCDIVGAVAWKHCTNPAVIG